MAPPVAPARVLALAMAFAVAAAPGGAAAQDMDDDPLAEGITDPSYRPKALADFWRRAVEPAGAVEPQAPDPADAEGLRGTAAPGRVGAVAERDAEAPFREFRPGRFETGLETVRERRREELEPPGLNLGTFTALPSVEIGTVRTSNVFRTAVDRKADARLSLRPALQIDSRWSRHAASLAAEGEWGPYGTYTSENVLRGSVTADGRADLSPWLAAGLRLGFAAEQEGRGSTDAVNGAARPGRLRSYRAEADISRRFNRLTATLRGGLALSDYDDVDLLGGGSENGDDRDVATRSVGARVTWELGPAANVYADISADRRSYSQSVDDDGFRRSSTGWRGALGTAVEIARLARLDLEAGYVGRNYDDAALQSISDATLDAALTVAVTPVTTFRAGAGTEVEETTAAGASARLIRSAFVGVDHEVLRHFIVSADLAFENEALRGRSAATDTLSASLAGEYALGRQAAIVAGASHEVERPDDGTGEVVENLVSVGLRLRR